MRDAVPGGILGPLLPSPPPFINNNTPGTAAGTQRRSRQGVLSGGGGELSVLCGLFILTGLSITGGGAGLGFLFLISVWFRLEKDALKFKFLLRGVEVLDLSGDVATEHVVDGVSVLLLLEEQRGAHGVLVGAAEDLVADLDEWVRGREVDEPDGGVGGEGEVLL